MAAAIQDATGIDAELIKGGGGIFEVKLDGLRIFSLHDMGRLPSNDEIISQLS